MRSSALPENNIMGVSPDVGCLLSCLRHRNGRSQTRGWPGLEKEANPSAEEDGPKDVRPIGL